MAVSFAKQLPAKPKGISATNGMFFAKGGEGSISGSAFHEDLPVVDAKVQLFSNDIFIEETTTNVAGYYIFSNLREDLTFDVILKAEGWEKKVSSNRTPVVMQPTFGRCESRAGEMASLELTTVNSRYLSLAGSTPLQDSSGTTWLTTGTVTTSTDQILFAEGSTLIPNATGTSSFANGPSVYHPDLVDPTKSWRVSFWFRPTTLIATYTPIFHYGHNLGRTNRIVFLVANTGYMRIYRTTAYATNSQQQTGVYGVPIMSINQWYFFEAIYDTKTSLLSFYINGNLDTTINGLAPTAADSQTMLLIGRGSTSLSASASSTSYASAGGYYADVTWDMIDGPSPFRITQTRPVPQSRGINTYIN